ncbi:MAG: hypothetical protein V1824_01595 [archaeon]
MVIRTRSVSQLQKSTSEINRKEMLKRLREKLLSYEKLNPELEIDGKKPSVKFKELNLKYNPSFIEIPVSEKKGYEIAKEIFYKRFKSASEIYKDYIFSLKQSDVYLDNSIGIQQLIIKSAQREVFKSIYLTFQKLLKRETNYNKLINFSTSEKKKVNRLFTLTKDFLQKNNVIKNSNISLDEYFISKMTIMKELKLLSSSFEIMNPEELFKNIYNFYNVLKTEGKIKNSKNSIIQGYIDSEKKIINIIMKNGELNQTTIHEIVHFFVDDYFGESHSYNQEEVVEFLSCLISKKNGFKVLDRSAEKDNNDYKKGYLLFKKYENEYGNDYTQVNKFLEKEGPLHPIQKIYNAINR